MTWAILKTIDQETGLTDKQVELDAPSTFSESREVIGGYNVTLTGSKRRFIKAVKKTWNFGYDLMSKNKYDEVMVVYNEMVPSGIQVSQPYCLFSIVASGLILGDEMVHFDISDRTIVPGASVLSSIEITLTQL